jgi:hypothetical protein
MKNIECSVHGASPYALICQHLHRDASLPYLLIEAEQGEPAQAWCQICDEVVERCRGWNEEAVAIAAWKLWCTHCFIRNLDKRELITLVAGGESSESQPTNNFVQFQSDADQLMRDGKYIEAENVYWQAWEAYADARIAANASDAVEAFDDRHPPSDAFWMLVSGANSQFSIGDFEGCIDTLETASNLFKDMGLVIGNPFFHLRVGQASLKVDPISISDNSSAATDNLARALICGGTEIFKGEDPSFLIEITAILRPPAGYSCWDEVSGYGCSVEKFSEATGFLRDVFAEKYGSPIGAMSCCADLT